VLSIEPQPRIARLLQANMALNAAHHVTVWQAALGESAGKLTLPPVDYSAEANFGGIALTQRAAGATVKVRPLDSIGLERCDFIKMDVEGMEQAAFAGALATVRRFHPVLWMEADRPGSGERLAQLARPEGYRCWELRIRGERERNFYRRPANIFVERYGNNFYTKEVLALPPAREAPRWLFEAPPHVGVRWLD
jgi:FkbM family methyltransferase